MTRIVKFSRFPGLRAIALLFLASSGLLSQHSIGPQSVMFHVNPLLDPSGQMLWRADDAWLEQSFQNTNAYIKLTNRSTATFVKARFYAEYYDGGGKLCLSAAFAQDVNLDGANGPFHPGESRTLSATAGVAPATKPRELKVWFLGEEGAPQTQIGIVAPVTVRAGAVQEVEGIQPRKQPDQSLLSLALVEANISATGIPASAAVVAAIDQPTLDWARRLVSKLRFAPETRGGHPTDARTLLLIRALWLSPETSIPAAPAMEDPWVQRYLSAKGGDAPVVPVVQLLRVQNKDESDTLHYFSIGTDWCLSVFQWVPDPTRGGTRREWTSREKLY